MRAGLLIAGCLAAAGASCALAPPAPDYDPWAWLIWGRELAGLGLSTEQGPAFKPLPVALSAVLTPLGEAAPTAWVILARAAALLAVALAYLAGRRVTGGALGGAGGAAGTLATGGFLAESAPGNAEGLVLALALGAWLLALGGRSRPAIACGLACALVRVEVWPFALAAAVWAWHRRPRDRPLLAAGLVAVPALWLGPELLGSGELLRSAGRARVAEPGQPGLGEVPALDSLLAGMGLLPLLVAPGLVALVAARPAPREGQALALTGVAWLALVGLMAQFGFSGEERYALPGAALVGLAGGAGVGLGASRARGWLQGWAGRSVTVAGRSRVARALAARVAMPAGCTLLAFALVSGVDRPGAVRAEQLWRAELDRDLERAVGRAGGPAAVLDCGRPYVGRYRGTLLAYRLGVAKRRVGLSPRIPGVVFRSRLRPGHSVRPERPGGFRTFAEAGRWQVAGRCGGGRS